MRLEESTPHPILGTEIIECAELGMRCKALFDGVEMVAYSISTVDSTTRTIKFHRLVISDSAWGPWAGQILSTIRSVYAGGDGITTWCPAVWCDVEDFRLAKALAKAGYFVTGEDFDLWGRLCYVFEVPLDDFSDTYIARKAEMAQNCGE